MKSASTEQRASVDQTQGVGPARPLEADLGPPPRRRWIRRSILVAILGTALLTGLSVIPALAMRGDLQRGKTQLTSAERLLLAGKMDEAAAAFDRARAAFDRASSAPGVFLLKAEGWIPFLGRTPHALLALTDIARDVSAAGSEVVHRVAQLPDGLAGLGPKDGRIPIETLASLAPVMHDARTALDRAESRAAGLPGSMVLGPVAGARDLVRQKLDQAVPLARAADALMHQLPAFAGASGPVRYFVAPQNLAEARGTGGLIGNYAILTIDHGRMSFGPFSSIGTLPNISAAQAPALSPLYDAFGGGGFWQNINMTPDAPSAASMIESLYERVRGERLDGTIFVDLDAMADMLRVTGPVEVPQLGVRLNSNNVVEFVATAGYLELPWKSPTGERRQTLGPRLVAEAILNRFFSGGSSEGAVRTLARAAAGGHILLHSAHPLVQAALSEARVAGGFGWDRGDFFSVVTSNGAANKVDFYLKRSVRYEVALGPNGAATATAGVSFRNDAPAGHPSYGLGPHGGTGLEAGEDQLWTSLYCPANCRLSSATENGQRIEFPSYRDMGLSMYGRFVRVSPQSGDAIRLSWDLPTAWGGDVGAGIYRLRLQGQPTAQPTQATVVIHAPAGMRVSWTNVPMRIDGRTASWTGVLGPRQDFEVRFGKPGILAAWSRLVRFVTHPAVRG